jgi:hypothetical protein
MDVSKLPCYEQEGYTLDRINNDGDYEPGNVRWATQSEQMRNTRRTHMLTYAGRTQCVTAWCEEFGIKVTTFYSRRAANWSVEAALTTPTIARGQRKNNRLITHDDKTQSARAWARQLGLRYTTLLQRLDNGWSIEMALTTPVGAARK